MSLEFKVTLNDYSGNRFDFTIYDDLYRFCESERDWWQQKELEFKGNNTSPSHFIKTAANFTRILNHLDTFKLDEWPQHTLNQQLVTLQKSEINTLTNTWIWSGHPYSNAIVNYNKTYNSNVTNIFLNIVAGKQQVSITNKDSLIGSVLAYEYFVPDSLSASRTKSELIAMHTVRDNIQKTNSKLAEDIVKFQRGFTDWTNSTTVSWNEWFGSTQTTWAELEESINNKYDESHDERKNDYIKFMDGCKTRIEELESTYQEKLRLEKPAEYWKKSAKKYGIQGSLWALSLAFATLMGIVYFYDFFSSWLLGQKLKIELSSLHGVLIFASILTVYAFLIKTLSKLTFSSFHLMRDAEEREQLTYLYLSLNQDSQLDSSSRDIVLQALFSRTDTGLLAGDSSPTMPGLSELIKSTKA